MKRAWLLGLPLRRWRVVRFARLLAGRLATGAMAVDVGSGPGYGARAVDRALAPARLRWLWVDPQPGMLSAAPADTVLGHVGRAVGDGAQLPVRSAVADLAVSLGVLCCMDDSAQAAAVAELWRILRPGGYVLVAVPRWRGADDEARLRRAGFLRVVGPRPGRAVFRKPL